MRGSFGSFLARQCVEKDVKLTELSSITGKSVSYLSDVKKGRRLPPNGPFLEQITSVFSMTTTEVDEMYDCSGNDRGIVSEDMTDYIMSEELPAIRAAIRIARDRHLTNDFWLEIAKLIIKEGKPHAM